mmetsp:Transcript_37736/g.111693  ORF Transcript_37736/g.111693 Transcript_37736/m.111693 type:complete len:107 (-) Transcript_37736:363-683(-)|eukprot:352542-Chlamydomonas_euryale.AAC.7
MRARGLRRAQASAACSRALHADADTGLRAACHADIARTSVDSTHIHTHTRKQWVRSVLGASATTIGTRSKPAEQHSTSCIVVLRGLSAVFTLMCAYVHVWLLCECG